jgi:hypothetical protein
MILSIYRMETYRTPKRRGLNFEAFIFGDTDTFLMYHSPLLINKCGRVPSQALPDLPRIKDCVRKCGVHAPFGTR